MKKRNYIIAIALLLVSFLIVDSFLPSSLENGPFTYSIVDDVEFTSDFEKIANKEVAIFAALNDNGEKNEFVISTIERKGILKNKYEPILFSPVDDEEILNPNYKNISISSFDSFYSSIANKEGEVYAGIVPYDCKSISIDGKQANLQSFSFKFNNEKVNFILYYCFFDNISESRHISVINANNDEVKIV